MSDVALQADLAGPDAEPRGPRPDVVRIVARVADDLPPVERELRGDGARRHADRMVSVDRSVAAPAQRHRLREQLAPRAMASLAERLPAEEVRVPLAGDLRLRVRYEERGAPGTRRTGRREDDGDREGAFHDAVRHGSPASPISSSIALTDAGIVAWAAMRRISSPR